MNALSPSDPLLAYRLRQQSLLADFGLFALGTRGIDALLDRATELCAEGMNAQFAKVLEVLPDGDRLLVRAGVGWGPGVVGETTIGADLESPSGYALHTGASVISNHLTSESRFRTPKLLSEHGVKRAINVVIRSGEQDEPFGVLEVDSTSGGQFDEADLAFMQGFANLLAVAIERHRAETALATREAEFRALFAFSPVANVEADPGTGRFLRVNRAFCLLTGYQEGELLGMGFSDLTYPDRRGHDEAAFRALVGGTQAASDFETLFIGKEGTTLPVQVALSPVRDPAGQVIRVIAVVQDISARKRAETLMREQVEHQETLIREVSHRVKNSLALVAALLGMQARNAKDPQVRRAIEDAGTRVGTVAEVHDQLWRRGEVGTVDLADFLGRLCAKLQETAPHIRLRFTAPAGALPMPTDRAVPLGLLVNELVTNAFKYAYPGGAEGEVRVGLEEPSPGRLRLEVADDGRGLPEDFDPARPGGSLGMRLVSGFVRQLGAQIDVASGGPGARVVLEVPTAG